MLTTLVLETNKVESVHTSCGHIIYLPSARIETLKRTHGNFYCTGCGRCQYWPDKSDLEKLEATIVTIKDQRDTARRMTQQERQKVRRKTRQLAAQKGVTTRIKNRISNGVCPCCRRTFKNLARHMKGQHPTYKDVKK